MISTGLGVIATALGLVNAFWSWMNKGTAATAKRLDDLEDAQGDHGRRIQSVEDALEHLPSKEAVHELDLKLVAVGGRLDGFGIAMDAVERVVRRIERHLDGGKS